MAIYDPNKLTQIATEWDPAPFEAMFDQQQSAPAGGAMPVQPQAGGAPGQMPFNYAQMMGMMPGMQGQPQRPPTAPMQQVPRPQVNMQPIAPPVDPGRVPNLATILGRR